MGAKSCPLQISQPAQILITLKATKNLPLLVRSSVLDDKSVSFDLEFTDAPKGAQLYDFGPFPLALTMPTALLLLGSRLLVKKGELVFEHLIEQGPPGEV